MSKPIASAPHGCCFEGVQHSGEPVGKIISFGGFETYVSEPKEPQEGGKKILLFFADVYSPLFINNKLIQDYFASRGYIVLGPDYFFGDAIYKHTSKPDFNAGEWISKAKDAAYAKFPAWVEAVKQKFGTTETKYTAVGYCFGGPFTLDLADTDLLAAAAIAHPAFLEEDHFTNLKAPLFLSCAEIDHTFPVDKRRRAEDLLVEKKAVYHFQVFSGIAHGFAVRGNPEVEHERWAKEESARSIIGWFDRFSK